MSRVSFSVEQANGFPEPAWIPRIHPYCLPRKRIVAVLKESIAESSIRFRPPFLAPKYRVPCPSESQLVFPLHRTAGETRR
jgi:hypothetical protein